MVVGQADGYAATNSVTATKTDTPLVDIPQTINVVTQEQLEDQALRSIGDVLRYVPGTTVQQGEGNRDQITIRGQESTSDFFLDGVRDDVQYFRGLYNIERVEILKGPYALIFGRGGGGGIINRVQKAPIAGETKIAGEGSINSFGSWELAGDVNTAFGDKAALRVNGFYEELGNHRDFYEGRRFAVNPYLGVKLGDDWKFGLSYEYVDDDRVTDRGIPSDGADNPARGQRDQFFGVPGINVTTLQAHIAKLRLDGKLSDNLSVSTTVLYGDYDKLYQNVYANGPVSATNTVALAGYTDPTTRENIIAQANAVWDVNTASIAHKILFGLEYGHQDTANMRSNAVLSNAVLDLNNVIFPTVAFPAITRNRVSTVEFLSAYMQDQISLSDHFDIVAGIRYDSFDINGIDIAGGNRAFGRRDEKISPRLGLIYKPQDNVSIYASYSQSFQPRSGDQFLTLSSVDENLEPEKFTNYEIGAKWDINSGLSVTAAVFRLDRTNNTTADPANPGNIILLPGTRAQGVELHIAGQVTDKWQVSGGYTFINAHVDGSNVRIDQQPKNQIALWNRYNLNDNFVGGLGVIHQSSQFASISNTVRLPAFTRVDAALFWDVTEKFGLQLNVENLLDTEYFSDAHNNNNISTGAPINARLTARMKF
ncbi:MAG: TonB-dependent siderophore receptor [Sphingomonadales bacterium]|nr:TonB-dependent siderophore receptor [Sphingomonadales bacterium]